MNLFRRFFRGSTPPDAPETQFDELKRSYSLEKVASTLLPESPSEERSSSTLAIACMVRHASKRFRSPMHDFAEPPNCGEIIRQMSSQERERANREHIALVYFLTGRIGTTRGMSHDVLNLAYTKFLGLLIENRLLRNDSDLQALVAIMDPAFQEYRTELRREDGPGGDYWLNKAAARRVLGVDTLLVSMEVGALITAMMVNIAASLDKLADDAPSTVRPGAVK